MTQSSLPLVLVAVLTSASVVPAQLAINEILLNQIAPNMGQQVVELVNTTALPFTPDGWSFCVGRIYVPLPKMAIPPGGIVRVHIGAGGGGSPGGENTATDWYIPNAPLLPVQRGELALYCTRDVPRFSQAAYIKDYLQWNGGLQSDSRVEVAKMAGIWPSTLATFVFDTSVNGRTIAWLGAGDGPDAWFDDSTPTLGEPNRPATYIMFSVGCAGSGGIPSLQPEAGFARPWAGSRLDLRLASLPQFGLVFVFTGLQQTSPTDLGVLGFPGCLSHLVPITTQLLFISNGTALFRLPIPADVSLEGAEFLNQALVLDQGANVGGATLTNPGKGRVGIK